MSALDLQTSITVNDGVMTVKRTQDCTPIADYTKAQHNAGNFGTKDMKHAASIPFVFIEDYCTKNNITFGECMRNKEHMRRIVNDPALAHFRIWKGRV
jgi:hypothetical protein